jgi:RHS repeat-associated protein
MIMGVSARVSTSGTLNWPIGDHLGSTVVTANASGGSTGTQLYRAWGEVRPGPGNGLATRYTFTGQADDGIGGLMFYRARWFDNQLGRFAQADSIIPGAGNPLAWDRYAGMANNAVRYADPSGHKAMDCDSEGNCEIDEQWQIDKGCNKTIYLGGKLCRLVPRGEFHVTWYFIPDIRDYSGESTPVFVEGLGVIQIPNSLMFEEGGWGTQGTIKVGEGQYISYFSLRYEDGNYTATLKGKPSLKPYHDGAVGTSYVGETIYIPAFVGVRSTGLFFGADRGGAIIDGDLDIFMGEGFEGIREGKKIFSGQNMKTTGVFGNPSNFVAYLVVCPE